MVDLDRIRARHNAWYNGMADRFPGLTDEYTLALARVDGDRQSFDEKAMAFEIAREDVPALIAEVEQLRAKLAAAMNSRRVIRRERDGLLEDLGRAKEENALLKRRLDGLTREEPE